MIKYFIDIFCKDTVIGLCQFEDIKKRRKHSYKKNYSSLFKPREEQNIRFDNHFIGPIAYPL